MLTRDATTTLTEQLAERYAERIRSRLLAPGARLPSVRDCAQRHGVSPHTVVAAYDQLLAQGLIEARRQRGFFVRNAVAPARSTRAPAPAESRPVAPVDATALIRSMFHHPGARPSPGLGTLPPEWLDLALLGGALRRVSQGDGTCAAAISRPQWTASASVRTFACWPPRYPAHACAAATTSGCVPRAHNWRGAASHHDSPIKANAAPPACPSTPPPSTAGCGCRSDQTAS